MMPSNIVSRFPQHYADLLSSPRLLHNDPTPPLLTCKINRDRESGNLDTNHTMVAQRHLVTYSKLGKFKPNKAVVARFRLTGTGRVKRWRCRTRHNRKRRGRVIMEESWRAQKIRIMLGKSRYNIRRHHCWVD